MAFVFVVVLILFGVLYMLSKNKYNEFITPLDKKTYSMKELMPMALYLIDKAKYQFNTKYDHGLYLRLGELYGHNNARYYLKVHWAHKLALLMLAILIIAFFAAAIGNPDMSFGVFALIVLGLIFYLTDNEINEKIKKRQLMMQIDFPDFLNKLILLINAGITILRAMEKIVLDRHMAEKKDRPLYDELSVVLMEIKAGKSEIKAYEEFAKKCKVPEITKFTSVIIQNLKKGNAELVSILRLQSVECWEMRKTVAKKLGEEASTKLLFPMMIMFVAILLIVITPAAMQLQGF